jgi:signal transduction histidine kinase
VPDFRLLFEASPALYLVVGQDLTIIAASDAYLAVRRAAREKVVGNSLFSAFPETRDDSFATNDPNLAASMQNVFATGVAETMPLQSSKSADGEERFWSPTNTPVLLPDGGVGYVIHKIEDVTSMILLKRAEREKEKLAEDRRARVTRLEAEVLSRSEELLDAYQQLQRLNAAQSVLTDKVEAQNRELQAFSYSVSHDLRAPLRQISSLIETLAGNCGRLLDAEGNHCLQSIAAAARELDTLIEDLLNFSLVSHAEVRPAPIDLTTLAQDVVTHLNETTAGAPTQWTLGDLPIVQGDASMIRVVFVNLVSNALKFASGRSERKIEIGSATSADADQIVFYVRDNGIGFDMDYAERLFGVFERLHSDQDFEGTGIGLATVRRIIEKHGGKTWAVSSINHGATFYCSLPAERSGLAQARRLHNSV